MITKCSAWALSACANVSGCCQQQHVMFAELNKESCAVGPSLSLILLALLCPSNHHIAHLNLLGPLRGTERLNNSRQCSILCSNPIGRSCVAECVAGRATVCAYSLQAELAQLRSQRAPADLHFVVGRDLVSLTLLSCSCLGEVGDGSRQPWLSSSCDLSVWPPDCLQHAVLCCSSPGFCRSSCMRARCDNYSRCKQAFSLFTGDIAVAEMLGYTLKRPCSATYGLNRVLGSYLQLAGCCHPRLYQRNINRAHE